MEEQADILGMGDPSSAQKLPTAEEVFAYLENLEGMDEATKEQIRQSIREGGEDAIRQMVQNVGEEAAEVVKTSVSYEIIVLLSMVSLVFLILGKLDFGNFCGWLESGQFTTFTTSYSPFLAFIIYGVI